LLNVSYRLKNEEEEKLLFNEFYFKLFQQSGGINLFSSIKKINSFVLLIFVLYFYMCLSSFVKKSDSQMNNISKNYGAYIGLSIPISSANIDGTGFMLGERAQYTATIGQVTISTANSNLDGTGTLGTLISGASNGMLIKTITIKGEDSNTHGMIRIFIDNGTDKSLIAEIEVPAVTRSSKRRTYQLVYNTVFYLDASDSLKVSTEKGEPYVSHRLSTS
jgi:hypothetical protein